MKYKSIGSIKRLKLRYLLSFNSRLTKRHHQALLPQERCQNNLL